MADTFDFGFGDGLLVGDDGEGFEGGGGKAGLPFQTEETADLEGEAGGGGELEAVAVALDDPATGIGLFEFDEGGFDAVPFNTGAAGEFFGGSGARGDEEEGFKEGGQVGIGENDLFLAAGERRLDGSSTFGVVTLSGGLGRHWRQSSAASPAV
jgi:hypothetical protein